jgi:hypothetical protein
MHRRGSVLRGGGVGLQSYISEESPNNVQYCPSGTVTGAMKAAGNFSDYIALDCLYANVPPQGTTCRWTDWVSEEQGTRYFDGDPNRPGLGVAIAVMCSGS